MKRRCKCYVMHWIMAAISFLSAFAFLDQLGIAVAAFAVSAFMVFWGFFSYRRGSCGVDIKNSPPTAPEESPPENKKIRRFDN